jgi:hypothetical protein
MATPSTTTSTLANPTKRPRPWSHSMLNTVKVTVAVSFIASAL